MFSSGTPQKALIPHNVANPERATTILLIHGGLVDRNAWDMVTPYLSEYHLLIPDLPSHGEARNIKPFSPDRAAEYLAGLIEARAKQGVAHIVGHSLGASVAIRLATRFPNLVDSVIISGYGKLPKTKLTPCLPYAMWTMQRVEYTHPRSLVSWLTDGCDLPRPDLSICSLDLTRQIFSDTLSNADWPKTWPARTLIIAATKGGIIIPSAESVEVARKLAEIGRESNHATMVVEQPEMRHPWCRQDPELFADTVKTWIEERRWPDGFLPL